MSHHPLDAILQRAQVQAYRDNTAVRVGQGVDRKWVIRSASNAEPLDNEILVNADGIDPRSNAVYDSMRAKYRNPL